MTMRYDESDGDGDRNARLARAKAFIIEHDLRGELRRYLVERSVNEFGIERWIAELAAEQLLTNFETLN